MPNLVMGLIQNTDTYAAQIGIGFQDNESGGSSFQYPTLLDQMVTSGVIARRAFSLWLDSYNGAVGNVLFGGVDTTKFIPPLISVPITKDSYNNETDDFRTLMTNLTLVTPNGRIGGFWPGNLVLDAVLGAETTLIVSIVDGYPR